MAMAMEKEEAVPLLTLSQSVLERHGIKNCTPKCRLKWLKQKGAILVVVWSFLVASVFHFISLGWQLEQSGSGAPAEHHKDLGRTSPTGIIIVGSWLLYPIGGWVADSFLGRHKTIRYSTWIMWLTTVVITAYQLLTNLNVIKASSSVNLAVFVLLFIFLSVGFGGFQANVIQLGIDQLTEASSNEITSFINSYILTLFSSGAAFHLILVFSVCVTGATEGHSLFTGLYVAVCLTIAVCLDFIFESFLVKERVPVTTNSVTLIARVVKFAFINGYWRAWFDCSSIVHTLDVAKQRSGGPFKNDHVEFVKTFFRMLVIIAIGTVIGGQVIVFSLAQNELERRFLNWNSHSCFAKISIRYGNFLSGTIFLLTYELLLYPLCNRCIPNISLLSIGVIGIVVAFVRVLTSLGIEVGAYLEHSTHNTTEIMGTKSCLYSKTPHIQFSSLWVLVLRSTEGLYTLLLIISGSTFTWAQAPSSMKGLVIGMMYAFLGLHVMLQSAISAPFLFIQSTPWWRVPLSCGIWYYTIEAAIVLSVFVVLVLFVKQYKQSQRNELQY